MNNSNQGIIAVLLMIPYLMGSGGLTQTFSDGLSAYKANKYKMALEIWRPLAKKGHVDAQFYLATLYDRGEGVKKNLNEAARWYKMAAKNDDMTAQYNLGWMYRFGKGVPKNLNKAVDLFKAAAKQGEIAAQSSLGTMYRHGEGLQKNIILAHMWMSIAATQGDYGSKRNLKAIETNMTKTQIQEAQQLAVLCEKKGFTDCSE